MKKILLIITMAVLALADIGKITVVKGDAFINRDVKSIKAYQPMPLFKQDVVETRQGRLQMHFIDNTVISLGRESRFVIKEYFYEENSKKSAATFEIEKGFIKAITGAIGKMVPEYFVMKTPATTVQPHGTVWSIKVKNNREHYEVIEGSISLMFNDGQERKVELDAGESMLLKIDANNPAKVLKASKKVLTTTKYEGGLEHKAATVAETRGLNQGTVIEDGKVKDIDGDGNKGHGNDPDGYDPDNPGQGGDNGPSE